MYMSLKAISRATLLHLSLNPLLSTTAAATATTTTTSPHLRSFTALYPLCPSYNLYQPTHNQGHPFSTSTAMSGESTTQPQPQMQEREDDGEQGQNKPTLALPSTEEQTTQIDLSGGGSTVKLDALGPLVVNQDGSLSRIANWEQMTEIEKRNTLRVLGKRNQLRLSALREAGGEKGGK